jgi:hypothetical protein
VSNSDDNDLAIVDPINETERESMKEKSAKAAADRRRRFGKFL